MYGERITLPTKPGLNHYLVKISNYIHMEDEPNYQCTDYVTPSGYHDCLENEYKEGRI